LDGNLRDFQLALGGSTENSLSLIRTASELSVESKLKISDSKIWIELDQLLIYLDPLFVFAESGV
jgi:hypothetical protein